MKVFGVAVPSDVIKAAIRRMTCGEPFVRSQIADVILKNFINRGDVAYRAADRLIQKERKAGHIKFDGVTWTYLESAHD